MMRAQGDLFGSDAAGDRLRQSEEQYRTLVEQLPLVSYIERLDEENAAYISPQIVDLTGYTSDEWVADHSFFATVLHPDDRERVLAGFAAMQESGDAFDCEYRVIARDGREVWVHDAAVVVRDEAGVPRHTQGYMLDITERKRAAEALGRSQARLREQMEKVEHQALHDGLTDLPNRTLFRDRTKQALHRSARDGSGFALLLLDLDNFKAVNDTFGHPRGDALLVDVATRLRSTLRSGDTVARLGGDEFGVIVSGTSTAADAKIVTDKLEGQFVEPFIIGSVAVRVAASIGFALFPRDGDDIEALVHRADAAMYAGKKRHSARPLLAD
jgi:diguanylate cyclase (GGDEF)-like protein/PAS domain S-box-containing protein